MHPFKISINMNKIFQNFDPSSAVGSAVGGLFGLIGQGIQNRQTRKNMRLQSQLNKEQMAHSMLLQRNQQNWLMNTQYGKMVSGMRNAGLNPVTANGTTPSVPSGGSPSTGPSGPSGSPLSSLGVDAVRSYKELKLMDAQIDNINADSDSKRGDAKLKEAQAYWQQFMNSDEMRNLTFNVKLAEALNGMKDSEVKDAEIKRIVASTNEICTKAKLNQSQTENVIQSTSNLVQQLAHIKASIGVLTAERGLKIAQSYLAEQQGHGAKALNESGLYAAQALSERKLASKLDKEGFSEEARNEIINLQKELMQFQHEVNQEVGVSTTAALGIVSGISDVVGKALGGIGGLSGFFKSPSGGIHINNNMNPSRIHRK